MNRFLVAIALLGATGVGAGCSGGGAVAVPPPSQSGVTVVTGGGSAGPPVTSHTPAMPAAERLIWLVRAGRLWPTMLPRRVEPDGPPIPLLPGRPTGPERRFGIRTAIPLGTQLLGFKTSGGVMTVDLSSRFAAAGTPSSERLRLAQLVYTATADPHVHGVLLQLDGKPVSVFSSEGIVLPKGPMTRAMYRRWLPALAITSPGLGGVIEPGTTITGLSVGGSDVRISLIDHSGHTILSGDTSSSCQGHCGLQSFSFPIDQLETPRWQQGTLVVTGSAVSTNLGTGAAPNLRMPVFLRPAFDVLTPAQGASLTSPATVRFGSILTGVPVQVSLYDDGFNLLTRRIVTVPLTGACSVLGPCQVKELATVALHFPVAGVQSGYLVLKANRNSAYYQRYILEVPVTLNGG
jgi:hypothetical protein